jgi:hypothetical protein
MWSGTKQYISRKSFGFMLLLMDGMDSCVYVPNMRHMEEREKWCIGLQPIIQQLHFDHTSNGYKYQFFILQVSWFSSSFYPMDEAIPYETKSC